MKKVILSILLVFVCITIMLFTNTTKVEAVSLDNEDLIKLSEALDAVSSINSYEMGDKAKSVFDPQSETFIELVNKKAQKDFNSHSYNFSGKSLYDISSKYAENSQNGFSAGLELSGGTLVPANVNADVASNFNREYSSELQQINDEYYEIYTTLKYSKSVVVDWLDPDVELEKCFSSSFTRDYEKINDLNSAINFLKDYGTHVFENYKFGGVLNMTNYICSEISIADAYSDVTTGYQISGQIDIAKQKASAAGDKTAGTAFGSTVNNSQTKTQSKVVQIGGQDFNVNSIKDAFTWSEYAIGTDGSKVNGYMYSYWMSSFEKENPVDEIVKTENPIAVWKLIENSTYNDSEKIEYIKKAFDFLCYEQYYDNCLDFGISNNLLQSINYKVGERAFNVELTSNQVFVPNNTDISFELGEYIKDYFGGQDFTLSLEQEKSDVIVENNVLKIGDVSYGTVLPLNINLFGQKFATINVNIKKQGYGGGYGTKDQPYLLSTATHFNTFLKSSESLHYEIINDIDMGGLMYEPNKTVFSGVLNGNGYTIHNMSIINKTQTNNVGLFGTNEGIIENLFLEDIRCLNNKVAVLDKGDYNVGIVCGVNKGIINNVRLFDCSIRLAIELKGTSKVNIGVLTGINEGNISFVSVDDCNVNGIAVVGEGTLNVGGAVGRMTNGLMHDVNVRFSNLSTTTSNNYFLGGVIGAIEISDNSNDEKIISYCVSNENILNKESGNYGSIAGGSTSNLIFSSCYYNSGQAVKGEAMNGCSIISILSIENIKDIRFEEIWTMDKYGLALDSHGRDE